jgi:membrane fusion protein, multidrug efflux system
MAEAARDEGRREPQARLARIEPRHEPEPAPAAPAPPTAPAAANLSEPSRRRRMALPRRLLRFVLLLVIPVVAVGYGAVWWGESMRWVVTENAYVKANVVAISADVSGRVIEVNVRENQRVERGQVLFRLDPRPFEIEVENRRAELAGVKAEIEARRAEYRSQLQAAREAQEKVRYLQGELTRQQQLTQRGYGTGVKLDEAQHQLELARRQLDTANEEARTILAMLGGDPNVRAEQHPKFQAKLAELDKAELDFDRATVLAPSAGVVGNVKLQVGEYVRSGVAVFSLVQADAPWVEANLKETQLTHVRLGQKATIVADAYPDVVYRTMVQSISPATGAEFSLLPPQNASGNWVKVVQRVPVRFTIEPDPSQPPLRAGMTVTVSIDTERDRSPRTMLREAVAWLGLDGVLPKPALAYLERR